MNRRVNGASATARILIVHENALLRDCLTSALTGEDGWEAAALDPNSDNWMAGIVDDPPTIVVIDLSLPGQQAFSLIADVRRILEQVQIVAIVSDANDSDLIDAVRAGPTACVSKWAALDELRTAIEHASRGECYCSPRIAGRMLAQMGALARSGELTGQNGAAVLSSRELEILRLIAEADLSNKQIARQLNISLYTVKNHVHNILDKLPVQNRHAAARFALKHRWL